MEVMPVSQTYYMDLKFSKGYFTQHSSLVLQLIFLSCWSSNLSFLLTGSDDSSSLSCSIEIIDLKYNPTDMPLSLLMLHVQFWFMRERGMQSKKKRGGE